MISQKDAKIILKDKGIDSLLETSDPSFNDPETAEYLKPVFKALKNLKKHLKEVANKKLNKGFGKNLKRAANDENNF